MHHADPNGVLLYLYPFAHVTTTIREVYGTHIACFAVHFIPGLYSVPTVVIQLVRERLAWATSDVNGWDTGLGNQ